MWMWSTGINRNIVECKVGHGSWNKFSSARVLIETLWNVKYIFKPVLKNLFIVLIETLWNVKLVKWQLLICTVWVLIETLWNVKFFYDGIWRGRPDRINRNIVECKVCFR